MATLVKQQQEELQILVRKQEETRKMIKHGDDRNPVQHHGDAPNPAQDQPRGALLYQTKILPNLNPNSNHNPHPDYNICKAKM